MPGLPTFTQIEVSEITGVPATSLQNWNKRRYFGPASQGKGYHREYSLRQVICIAVMQRLVDLGVQPYFIAEYFPRLKSFAADQITAALLPPGVSAKFDPLRISYSDHFLILTKSQSEKWHFREIASDVIGVVPTFATLGLSDCVIVMQVAKICRDVIERASALKPISIQKINAISVASDPVSGEFLFNGRTKAELDELLAKTNSLINKKKGG